MCTRPCRESVVPPPPQDEALYRRLTTNSSGARDFAPPMLSRLKSLGISKTANTPPSPPPPPLEALVDHDATLSWATFLPAHTSLGTYPPYQKLT